VATRSLEVFRFWEISDNNSKTVQDRRIVSTKSNKKSFMLMYDYVADDFE